MGEVVQDNTHVGLSLKGNQKSWKRVQKRCLSPCMHQHDFMLYSCLPPKPINMGLPKLKLLGKSSATQPLHFIGLRPKEEEGFPKVTFMHSFTHLFAVSLQNLSCKPPDTQVPVIMQWPFQGQRRDCTPGTLTLSTAPSHLVEGVFISLSTPCPYGWLGPLVLH